MGRSAAGDARQRLWEVVGLGFFYTQGKVVLMLDDDQYKFTDAVELSAEQRAALMQSLGELATLTLGLAVALFKEKNDAAGAALQGKTDSGLDITLKLIGVEGGIEANMSIQMPPTDAPPPDEAGQIIVPH